MEKGQRQLRALPITFEIYACDEQEVEECRKAIIAFIAQHRSENRAVTARKVAEAISRWDRNPIVRNRIIGHFT